MAEVKNAFIKSKMNLDLDARLVPQGEYRQGFNIQVSKSEGDDVGALENVLGNILASNGDFQALNNNSANAGLQAIGYITDPKKDIIYIFLTNHDTEEYNPNKKSNFIYSYSTLLNESVLLVTGEFLNFSTQWPIHGINILEDFLFWTDGYNQPRKINVNLANPQKIATPNYYTTEDHISVAKFAPYQAIELYQQSTIAPAVGEYESTMKDVVSDFLPNGTTPNPYKDSKYAGDPDYLEDKFVRFSYRFKFEDNEYSCLAPFTQECFIPKQDGYFITNGTPGTSSYVNDEEAAYRSTIVNFMENKVNEITLNIPLPSAVDGTAITGTTLNAQLKVKEIDIVYKESDGQAVQVVETIPVNSDFATKNSGAIISYIYQGLKPYKTLPESDLIRVYDKVPVKAFAQEVSGNRIIYGNFQNKHTPVFQDESGNFTSQLNYKVGAFDKSVFATSSSNPTENTTSIIEYPNSTLKQNRNYQVGVIVSDRYGRSSTVLLSKFVSESETFPNSGTFAASTHYNPYRISDDTPVHEWPGDALKILFKEQIKSVPDPAIPGIPGLYNGTPGASYNILGWYSYKIVVKQFEQEYYNVYLPGILNGPPDGVTGLNDTENEVGFITLINDNINKVPRDLSEVGPEQKQFRSSVQLFGRVTPNFVSATFPSYNEQFYPGVQSNTAITIGEAADVLGENVTTTLITNLYDSKSNPLIARISQIDSLAIGSAAKAGAYPFQLGVFETEPTESRLDIYYETSTSGLIDVLNSAIATGENLIEGLVAQPAIVFNEKNAFDGSNNNATEWWSPKDTNSLGAPLLTESTVTITSVSTPLNTISPSEISSYFTIDTWDPGNVPYDPSNPTTWWRYRIKTARDYAYIGNNPEINEVYEVVVNVLNSGTSGAINFTLPLSNENPIFKTYTLPNQQAVSLEPLPSNFNLVLKEGTTGTLATFTGVNGSADNSLNTSDLSWSITSPVDQTIFSIGEQSGILSTTQNLSGPYPITITLTDAGGVSDATNFSFTLLFGNEALNPEFGKTSLYTIGGGGESGALYFVNNLTNAAGSYSAPGFISGNTNNDIRAPYNTPNQNLQLSPNVKAVTDDNGFEYVNITAPDCSGFTMGNRNQNAMALQQGVATGATGLDQAKAGLRQGTAFIGVEITFNQPEPSTSGFSNSNYPFLLFPIYLQYRPFGTIDAWVTATDIEGKPINFGGSQINRNNYKTADIGTVEAYGVMERVSSSQYFNYQGVNKYPNGFSPTNIGYNLQTSQYDGSDCLEVNLQVKNPGSNITQNAVARKTFVIGKSPHANISDKFGDYRLIVRYPWGEKSSDSANAGATDPIVVGYSTVECPSAGFAPMGAGGGGGSMVTATAFFDDFYYPSIYNGTNIYAYKYRISAAPSNSSTTVLSVQPSIEVWAREWHLKYVTQFYSDPNLITPFTHGKGWYIYSPWENDSIPANYGTDYSNVVATGDPSAGISQNNFRKWTAYLDDNGVKSLAPNPSPSIPCIL